MSVKILLTGFEPFGKDGRNPSSEAVERLSAVKGVELEKVILPVSWSGAWGRLLAAWEDFSPDGVLMTGLAGGSDPSRTGRNKSLRRCKR